MEEIENPAGRLHALLTAFGQQKNTSILQAWANVLELELQQVHLRLGSVGLLLNETEEAARGLQSERFEKIPSHLNKLSKCIFPTKVSLESNVNDLRPDGTALEAVGMLSYALQAANRDSRVPDEEELSEIRAGVDQLMRTVQAATLAPEIRKSLLVRLADMLEALDHLNVGGPEGVRKAAEALAITAYIMESEVGEAAQPLFQRARHLAVRGWVAFTIVTTLANAALTFERLFDLGALPPATEQRQLPAGETSEGDSDGEASESESEASDHPDDETDDPEADQR